MAERAIKSKNTSFVSNVGVGSALTKLFLLVVPSLPAEFVPFVGPVLVGSLAWVGTSLRDLAHKYQGTHKEMNWFAEWAIGLIG